MNMQSSANNDKIGKGPAFRTATRYGANWSYRGDNTKYKGKK